MALSVHSWHSIRLSAYGCGAAGGRWVGWHLLPLVALVPSQECRRVGARSSPRPDGVWGEKNAPMVSHHGYVRARRTSPGRSLCVGVLVGQLPRRRWSGN